MSRKTKRYIIDIDEVTFLGNCEFCLREVREKGARTCSKHCAGMLKYLNPKKKDRPPSYFRYKSLGEMP